MTLKISRHLKSSGATNPGTAALGPLLALFRATWLQRCSLLETKWVREADRQSPSLKSPLSSQSNVIQEWSTVSVTWQQSPWPKATSYCVSFKVTFVGKVLELTECKPPVTYPSPSQCFLDIYCVKMMSKKNWSSAQS